MTYRIGENFRFEYFGIPYIAYGETAKRLKALYNHVDRNLQDFQEGSRYLYNSSVNSMLARDIADCVFAGIHHGSVEKIVESDMEEKVS